MSLAGISTALAGDMFASVSPSAYSKKAKAQDATTTGSTTDSTSGTSTSSSSTSSIGTTFMNLLVQELQNQDPTAPVDSTAMVGQMISLNQLDQLVSINGALGGSTSTSGTSTSGSTATSNSASSVAASAAHAQLTNALNTAAANASDPSQPLNLASLSSIYGGK